MSVRSIVALLVACCGVLLGGPANADECHLIDEFRVIKNSTNWEFLYRGKTVVVLSGSELHDIFGGNAHDTSCANQLLTPEAFGFIVGWKHDLLLAFGIQRDERNIVVGLQKLQFYPHDSAMQAAALPNNQLTVKFGRKQDLNFRVCWNPTGDKTWWHSGDYRVPQAGGCTSNKVWSGFDTTNIIIN